ncbi:pilus assembly protein Flp/PilA [Pseudomonas sp. BIGb0278]|jgi:pilus assembly protein Flp/PilA|uniref:Pilin n=2 Tax=Pseudomonas TaxID=286 RepID=A0A2S3W9H3_PSEPU|nr:MULTISPECIES: Flp family type IVb pilin [Pseudomonas]AUF94745.1 Flp family type IVb pilin [Pseudomonas sp. 02C 26]MBA1199453.1 Flp family type IVb pilin [Pseudomonas plecoglossicida]MBO0368988.1 Flp family type IVb pilin [Pseudomonas putida]MBV4501829.1 Flp family type IVb pilin [Pseudomonas shirazensis]MCS4283515.1 pilus assembly protein Flp/PilA [Pseudomonas sp. BIGb0278]
MLLLKIYTRCKTFIESKDGASGIEYAVIAAMVAVALAAFVTPISTQVTALMTTIQTAITR